MKIIRLWLWSFQKRERSGLGVRSGEEEKSREGRDERVLSGSDSNPVGLQSLSDLSVTGNVIGSSGLLDEPVLKREGGETISFERGTRNENETESWKLTKG